MQSNNNYNELEESNSLNLRAEIEKYFLFWRWFVISAILGVAIAFIYLRYTSPSFSASASIMIKDNKKSGISAELAAFEDLGIIGGGSANNTDNEIEILKSRKIIERVVDSLNLNISYYIQGRILEHELYKNSPIKFHFTKRNLLYKEKDTTIIISFKDLNTYDLKNQDNEFVSNYKFGEEVESKLGFFKIYRDDNFSYDVKEYFVKIRNKNKIIDSYRESIFIEPVNKNSSVLTLSLKGSVKKKIVDVLDELVKQYNIDAIKDKNQISIKTKIFIDERLSTISKDLAAIDDNVKKYKSKNGFTGASKEVELVLESGSLNTKLMIDTNAKLKISEWIQEKLDKNNEVLPVGLGFEDANISFAIENYNKLVLRRNQLLPSAGIRNPNIIDLNSSISSLKSSLIQSLTNLQTSLKFKLQQLKNEQKKINSKISSIPKTERGFIDIAREQEIFAGLYSYLLKKKEETDISLAVTVPNAKIIDKAYGSNKPVFPKKNIVYFAAIFLGLLIPFLIVYIKNLLDTKIHSRRDIEILTNIPFLGDITHSETKEKIVISKDSRSSSSEAFRLIRTNLGFMMSNSNEKLGKTIFITSTTSGEGKSFISINLAAALSLSKKKVLLIGLDLRAPKVTEYLGIAERKGITNFIMNEETSINDVKFSIPEIENLDIIASGVIPPNPAELLLMDRVKKLFEDVKQEYDYIIVDTAPVNLVTDTLLVSKYADMFLYVVRANYLDKRMLEVPQTLYREKKLPNMAIVLNDTDIKKSYGYGYRYGYGYFEKEKKTWYRKLF